MGRFGVLVAGNVYFLVQNASFLLQDLYSEELANNFMIHLLVENANDWHGTLLAKGLIEKYGTQLSDSEERPWKMIDFTVVDPSGILWRIAHTI